MTQALRNIIDQNRSGKITAIPSVCTAHPDVLFASLHLAESLDRPLVIEATSNQVNQDGGYTGMRAGDYVSMVHKIADQAGTSFERVTFGGDHLGPQAWRNLDPSSAMQKAEELISDYVEAGISKIHLDCSEGCAGEPAQLPDEITASRAATLASVAVSSAASQNDLLFVVGTEVPPPGGARTDDHGNIAPTSPQSARKTIDAHQSEMADNWDLVGALVVQPGVEFTPTMVHALPPNSDKKLRDIMLEHKGLCLEAHSTDYQEPDVFPRLADLGFAFQKVGPILTYAWRRALYKLDHLIGTAQPDHFPLADVLDLEMVQNPAHWQGHYHGDDLRTLRHFGLADRIRYYWPAQKVEAAVKNLFEAHDRMAIPDREYQGAFSPETFELAETIDAPFAKSLALAEVQRELRPYFFGGPTDV